MYTLSVSGIEDLTMAHVHLGNPGRVGEHVAPLYPAKTTMTQAMDEKKDETRTAKQKKNGVIAKGEIRSNDLMGSLKGKTLADLVAEFRPGNAYVNVHTKEYPNGEIRGPIQ
jgi:hypothetical protein